jgi:hypothetical protein
VGSTIAIAPDHCRDSKAINISSQTAATHSLNVRQKRRDVSNDVEVQKPKLLLRRDFGFIFVSRIWADVLVAFGGFVLDV